jgi:hypothetical protein
LLRYLLVSLLNDSVVSWLYHVIASFRFFCPGTRTRAIHLDLNGILQRNLNFVLNLNLNANQLASV